MDSRQARPEPLITLLIDADNCPPSSITAVLTELSKLGVVNIRRAYGNWAKASLKGWRDQLHDRAIRPMQQFDYSKGKNASDMAMVVDAMDLLYSERPDVFALMSSDSDFTPLVMHLRAKGATVLGFGARTTPQPFVTACSRFLYLDALGGPEPDDPEAGADPAPAPPRTAAKKVTVTRTGPVPTKTLRQDARLVRLLREAAVTGADESGWARVAAVGQQIANQDSFDTRNYGYSTLTKLLKATELFEFRDEGSPSAAVRDRRLGG